MSFYQQSKKYPIRTVKTALIGLINIGLGIFLSTVSLSILDLQILTGSSTTRTAMLLPIRTIGYIVGTLFSGFFFHKFCHQIVLMSSLLVTLISSLFLTLFPSIFIMYVIILFAGFANGIIDTIQDVWILHLWGKEKWVHINFLLYFFELILLNKISAPFFQIIQFFYCLGLFIAPVVVNPFLTSSDNESSLSISQTSFSLISFLDNPTLDYSNLTRSEIKAVDVKIKWPFILIAIYDLFILCLFMLIYILYADNPVHPSRIKNEENNEMETDEKKDKLYLTIPLEGKVKFSVIAICTLIMHSYSNIEFLFDAFYLMLFAEKSNLKMSRSKSLFLASTFWSAYTFLKIFSLILIVYFSPSNLLLISFSIIMFSNLILVPFGNQYEFALWLSVFLIGLGCSSVPATIFSFTEQFTEVTPGICAAFLVVVCIGEFILLPLDQYMDKNPEIFLWTVLFYSSFAFICFFILIGIQKNLLNKQKKKNNQNKFELKVIKSNNSLSYEE